ncbi:Hypothetical predicted protein [Marmota monax]|uniref:IGFBP N-terminal domain-containing protein n=1 Tax=Marmota monax TaxID=9995 RepID=A0A5E4CJH2_MARMO|nr:hypothetical protein GHT09_003516 [Marmota monax]VTJ82014.1 Hypothetical predicted protein [Marmota monax]
MPEVPAAGLWPFLLLLAVQVSAVASSTQPWHCAPCSAERLALCPPVPSSCPELSRPAGCGCCPMCALPLGAACGVATARCARGLSCRALPGEPRPLHALTRGQGACVPEPATPTASGLSSIEEKGEGTIAPVLGYFRGLKPDRDLSKAHSEWDTNGPGGVLEAGVCSGEKSFSHLVEAQYCWVLGEVPLEKKGEAQGHTA